MRRVDARVVVGVFGGLRMAIGTACVLAPRKFAPSGPGRPDTLMSRSFAVRELVIGLGGLLAFAGADPTSGAVRTWDGLGALTDAGDVLASVAALRTREPLAGVSALVAAGGLAAESWAFHSLAAAPLSHS